MLRIMLNAQTTQTGAMPGLPAFQPVKIQKGNNGPEVASARELYEKLGFDSSQWSRWSKKNILDNPFAKEGEDWIVFDMMSKTSDGGRPSTDYALMIDFAKRLCMLARTYQGEAMRRYFIQCERELLALSSESPKIAALVKLVNKLTDEVIGLKGDISCLRKEQSAYFAAQKTIEAEQDELGLRIKREKILTFAVTIIRKSPIATWTIFWDRFEEAYNCNIRGLQREPNEMTLDAAIRHGYINQLWEYINIQ